MGEHIIEDVLSQMIDEYGDGDVLVLPPRDVAGEGRRKVLIVGSPGEGYRVVRINTEEMESLRQVG